MSTAINTTKIFYDYMLPPKAIKMVSRKLQIYNHVIHPCATDGYILMSWDEIKRLYKANIFDEISILPAKESVYFYDLLNKKEYVKEWIEFSNLVVNATNDKQCDYANYFVRDECSLDTHKEEVSQKEIMFSDAEKSPAKIRIVSEALQLDKYIEQKEIGGAVSFDNLMSLEQTNLFEKILFYCKDSLYSYFPSDDKPERKFDWNNRWWNIKNVVLIESEKDKTLRF